MRRKIGKSSRTFEKRFKEHLRAPTPSLTMPVPLVTMPSVKFSP